MKFDTCNNELSNLILLKTQKELYQCKIELLSYEKKNKDDTSNGSIGAKSLRDEGTKINSSCSQTSNSDGELVNIKIVKSLLLLTQKKLSEKVINESNTRVVVKSSLESILNRTKFDSRLLNLSNKIDLDISFLLKKIQKKVNYLRSRINQLELSIKEIGNKNNLQVTDLERKIKLLNKNHEDSIELLKSKHSDEVEAIVNKHGKEISDLKENYDSTIIKLTEEKEIEAEKFRLEILSSSNEYKEIIKSTKKKLDEVSLLKEKLKFSNAKLKFDNEKVLDSFNEVSKENYYLKAFISKIYSMRKFKSYLDKMFKGSKYKFSNFTSYYTLEDDVTLLYSSELFDPRWYRENSMDNNDSIIDPALHYLTKGAKVGKNPSCEFDTNAYLMSNNDVKMDGMNPLIHYLRFGIHEGRSLGMYLLDKK
ncbi:hypothetical protein [Alteromonas australica]|uniref:hypothetical protein n=1 Tax=Alteromonas australica TaxID=589873 RepID=UPI0005C53446|nr:hypothetical protein [Alteromonas australica]